MAAFTVRVELHDSDDYEALHEAMREEGFLRLIKATDGTRYHLPTAEYNRIADLTVDEVLKSAKRAAATVCEDFAVLVTESQGRRWDGLDEA